MKNSASAQGCTLRGIRKLVLSRTQPPQNKYQCLFLLSSQTRCSAASNTKPRSSAVLQGTANFDTPRTFSDPTHHGINNNKTPNPKFRLLLVFNRVYRLEILSVMLVVSSSRIWRRRRWRWR
jgi:hypothetical protein